VVHFFVSPPVHFRMSFDTQAYVDGDTRAKRRLGALL
jgi:hypothetical protein